MKIFHHRGVRVTSMTIIIGAYLKLVDKVNCSDKSLQLSSATSRRVKIVFLVIGSACKKTLS